MPWYELYTTDTDKDGDLEVHTVDCHLTKGKSPNMSLSFHNDCYSAVRKARKLYPFKRINGCRSCSTACHTN